MIGSLKVTRKLIFTTSSLIQISSISSFNSIRLSLCVCRWSENTDSEDNYNYKKILHLLIS